VAERSCTRLQSGFSFSKKEKHVAKEKGVSEKKLEKKEFQGKRNYSICPESCFSLGSVPFLFLKERAGRNREKRIRLPPPAFCIFALQGNRKLLKH